LRRRQAGVLNQNRFDVFCAAERERINWLFAVSRMNPNDPIPGADAAIFSACGLVALNSSLGELAKLMYEKPPRRSFSHHVFPESGG